MEPGLTRGQFLRTASGAAAGLLWPGAETAWCGASGEVATRSAQADTHSFRSRPDLHPPRASVRLGHDGAPGARAGYWLLVAGGSTRAQTGPLILDARGRPVWFKPMPHGWFAMNLRAQSYQGRPVLTWWEGSVLGGKGEGVIMDPSYREIIRVQAGNGHQVDPHEFLLTPEGTALITASPSIVSADLSSVGGSRDGQVSESVIQEIDLSTGRVLLEWRSLEHVPVTDSYMRPGGVYDYFHANSIDVTPDGNLLVSGRHTWGLYKLERMTGRVMWRLGGKRSDFAMDHDARFAWQHDGRQTDERTITVFDDGAAFFEGQHRFRTTHSQSRGLALTVDHAARRVTVDHAYHHRRPLLVGGYGNMQTLANGDVVIGWGNDPVFSQLTAAGSPVVELELPLDYASYRVYRQPWIGTPSERPRVAVRRGPGRRTVTVYASWNGDTRCSAWRVSAGASRSQLRPVAVQRRTGFETAIEVPVGRGYVAVRALDRAGRALASSSPVRA